MEPSTRHVRPAQPIDGAIASVLLYSAYTHTHVTYPLPASDDNGFVTHLQQYASEVENRFSYQQIMLADVGSQVVGLVLSFGGRDEARLNAAIGNWLTQEAKADEWYIDALAVLSSWGHQGIGTRLLQEAESQARQHHYLRMALNVDQNNTEAISLYTRCHYLPTQQTLLYQRPHIRMEKSLNDYAPFEGF